MAPSTQSNVSEPVPAKAATRVAAGVSAKPGGSPNAAATAPAAPMVPGAETVWEKYAPNGEPVISGLVSLFSHGLVFLVIAVGIGWLLYREPAPPLEVETVEIGDGFEGGGGGNQEGVVIGNPNQLSAPQDTVKTLDQDKTPPKSLPEDDPEIKARQDPTVEDDFLQKIKRKPSTAKLGPVLKDAMEGLAGKGKGGTGKGGGEGTGEGTGRGSKTGPGTGPTNRRGARNLRWELAFGFSDAQQYLQQTNACGMILVVPDKDGRLMTIRETRPPAHPQYEDVKAMNRNWFTDDRPQSAESVAAYLQLDIVPQVLLFFYPQEFEKDLVAKEVAFRGRKEEDIEYTKFSISFSGGKPVIRVIEQRPKPGRK